MQNDSNTTARKISHHEITIVQIGGEPNEKPAGSFLSAQVMVEFLDERAFMSRATIALIAPFDPAAPMSALRSSIMAEARAVIGQVSDLLCSGSPAAH